MRVYKKNTSGPFTLTTGVSGEGTVSVSPQNDHYALNDTVTLHAAADEGYAFLGWTGDLNASDDSIVVTMT
ncbi:MAG: InlB B-repeat-containing protein [Chitinivibrionales bacterium]